MSRRSARRIASRAGCHLKAIGAIVGSFLVPVIVLAQTPDFSGEWKRDSSRRGGGLTTFGLFIQSPPERLAIRQDREVLYVDERGGLGVSHMKYGLVAQTIIQSVEGPIVPSTARSRSRWDGTKLVTAIDVPGSGSSTLQLQEVRFLRPDGAMVVELRKLEDGRNYLVWSAIYKKAASRRP